MTERLLEVARAAASEAAAVALSGWRRGTEVRHKGRIDLVTDYDLRSEQLLRQRIAAAFPGHRIVGEESEAQGSGDVVWYIDPIDGTTNFAHGHPFFAVSIGVYDRDTPVAAVVQAPALGIEWWGAPAVGAFRNGERCRVSAAAALIDALAATGFAYRADDGDDNVPEFRAFLRQTRGVRRCGAAAIDLAMVADGTFDLYWEQRLSPWDMAAGALLVVLAGGRISDYDGGPGDPLTGRLVATNGHVHDETLGVLRAVREGRA